MYTLINGSPKPNKSNSLYFLNIIKDNCKRATIYELKKDSYEHICDNIKLSDTIIFAFPLYVDSPSSIILKFLDYIIDNKIKIEDKNIYIIINCGFREGKQNINGLNIMKRWCEKTKTIYKGSILIGAGEIIGKSKYRFISRKALKKLNEFSLYVKDKKTCSDIVTTIDFFNNKTYCYLANVSWNKKGRKNKLTKEQLKIK